ncbi:MAG: SIMPL domain-containing protein [Phascolarctobacterium sp.]|nr:SIMPL domain-containing protein [Phascolarctobacterium sp.]
MFNRKIYSSLKLLLLVIFTLYITTFNALSVQAASPNENCIMVNAGASMEVAPDLAYLRCNIVGKGATAAAATANTAKIINDVRHSLLGLNIISEDIVNMSYNTHSTYDNKGKVTGYKAETSLRITVRELKKLGNVIDKITASGVNNINGITYTLSDKNLYRSMLLAKAVENARQQAAVVANAGGRTLGTLLSASFSTVNQVERSAARPMLNKMATADGSAPTEIEAKNITISVNVNTIFKLL